MSMSGGSDDGEPMMEMNTTPLIDVLLVLLIMFIITLPIQTHAVKVDLPQNNPNSVQVNADKNKVSIDPTGVVAWNGQPVDDVTLRQFLDQTKTIDPEPELHFQPDPAARYEVVDRILAVIKKSGVGKLGFIGNEQYRNDF
ncbi:MAG: biopolymer transporter ExbD [Sphingomonas sp.]|uniref:ExbD/TolR family protein n=1 Tax=Sphingomonas sp. TaxID=28214 RepID=UPI0025EFAA93|nr:biopolymer transporter ExbD [Sphingomonas sp.]MBY0285212.1 biopolymer transporter ExbD [Sphingomonas sp.]